MASPSAVSVIVPAYNEEHAIANLVTELRTSDAWHEIIVIDDGSRDATAERAAEAGARVVRHPYNKGNGAAVKTGIRNATGEYILIVDGDGVVRATFIGPVTATDLWAAVAEAREPGSTPVECHQPELD